MTARRILLVDDEDDIRTVAAMSLRAVGGHDVLTADSGAAALELASREPVDVVLLDVMMPGLDGPSTLAQLRAQGVSVPVVFLTAKMQVGTPQPWDGLPAAGVIAKPFDPMSLATEVAGLVGWD